MADNRASRCIRSTSALFIFLGSSTVLFSSPVQAIQQDPFEACAGLTDNADRLACFDTVMANRNAVPDTPSAAPAQQSSTGAVAPPAPAAPAPATAAAPPVAPSDDYVVLSKKDAAELRRKAGERDREVKREAYDSKIVRVFTTGYKVRNVQLANGETWRELTAAVGTKPRKGDVARITPGILGSWTVQYGDRDAKFKVKRVLR